MARFSRLDVLTMIRQTGVVPVFYHGDLDTAKSIVQACFEGGAPVLEFTNRGDFAWEVFAGVERFCSNELPGAILGAGSVIDSPTAGLYVNNGASFVVGPSMNPEVASFCNRRKVAYIPGCATATEISNAEALGCEVVKVFPGDAAGGPDFVRAVLAPMPWSSIMPTGGVDITRDSLEAWFRAGVFAVGIGSRLVSPEIVKSRDWAGLTRRTRTTVDLIAAIRGAQRG
ncbi:MAG: bifunctional 4-hydroxy-2-oxoglutarate aldolase/2-dehydro-3-deoxy-phosphogluconate aldolase [Chloroflexi bacterium]|nr:bifunctional 4-hydroxy-2-oxoglutarate aldolase/2-dehydro-3-deoxy-phosphogluconate aldolase [Chloroflexota bacterium]